MAASNDNSRKQEVLDKLLLDIDQSIDIECSNLLNDSLVELLEKSEDSSSPDNPENGCYNDIFYKPVQFSLLLNSSANSVTSQSWGKSLAALPPLTIKEIEEHRLCSG